MTQTRTRIQKSDVDPKDSGAPLTGGDKPTRGGHAISGAHKAAAGGAKVPAAELRISYNWSWRSTLS